MALIAWVATAIAVIQNLLELLFGVKEGAIAASPSFIAPLLLETFLVWVGYALFRHLTPPPWARAVLSAWALAVIAAAEVSLPASTFSFALSRARRRHVLNDIRVAAVRADTSSIENGILSLDVSYTLVFPRTASFRTFPAYIGPTQARTFGEYAPGAHPEYLDREYVFKRATPYEFRVYFRLNQRYDLSQFSPTIQICDDQLGPFMACRRIQLLSK